MNILGIESSCDETAASIVADGKIILSSVVESQIDLHAVFGGVVPEIASRSHLEAVIPVIDQAIEQALHVKNGISSREVWDQIDAIAVTHGPGLSGSLLIGTLAARTLAWLNNKPLIGVNHVLAHPYVNWFTDDNPKFPLLALIVSGGHTQLMMFENHFKYQLLGQTRDDAVGEAFDKVAKMLGLEYPGGPSVSRVAQAGNATKYKFPIARMDNPYDFSFSGLKTAVLRTLQAEIGEGHSFSSTQLPDRLSEAQKQDTAASFQYTAIKTLVNAVERAVEEFNPVSFIIGGGVAANVELREQLKARIYLDITYPPLELCTDNAAMIAGLGFYQFKHNYNVLSPLELSINPSLSL